MKKRPATKNAPITAKAADSNSTASVKPTPPPVVPKARNTPTDKQADAANGESRGPSAMDLLQIAHWFELITPEQIRHRDPCDKDLVGWGRVLPYLDNIYLTALEDAAHLYDLANLALLKPKKGDLWSKNLEAEAYWLRVRNLENIWASAQSGKMLPVKEAFEKLNFKTYPPFESLMREFGLHKPCGEEGKISNSTIRVLRILRKNRKREYEAIKKRAQRASKSQKPVPSEPKLNPEKAYRKLLQDLKSAFEEAKINVDASLFL
jgi:hypothetical protein